MDRPLPIRLSSFGGHRCRRSACRGHRPWRWSAGQRRTVRPATDTGSHGV